MSMQLYDSAEKRGTNLELFFDTILSMDSHTHYCVVPSEQISLLSVNQEKSTDDKLVVYQFSAHTPVKIRYLSPERLKKAGADDELIREFISGTKLMFLIKNRIFFTSASMLLTLSARTGIGGPSFYEPSLHRDAYIAERMSEHSFSTKIMYRTNENGVNKIFATFSKRYAPIPQKILKTIISNLSSTAGLGSVCCKDWFINNWISEIYLEFPDKAEDFAAVYGLPNQVVPGLYLATSDTGNCAITARETWTIKGVRSLGQTYKRIHKGEIDPKDVIGEIEETIFAQYTRLPEKLCDLLQIEVNDPVAALKSAFSQLDIVKAVGKEAKTALLEAMIAEINPSIKYTAYDIALSIMEMPKRCAGISSSAMRKLESTASKAAFINYNGKVIESDVYLTA